MPRFASRVQAAERGGQSRERPYRSPWWYRVGQALSIAASTLLVALGQSAVIAFGLLILSVFNVVLSLACRRATGIPIPRFGSAARGLVNLAGAAVFIGIAFGAHAIVEVTNAAWVAWGAALLVGAGLVAFGRVDDDFIEDWLVDRETEPARTFSSEHEAETPS
ncbi:hypothetical protein HII28_10135 [Planctomonas sp. JC2975]|uniref:hypothetical protein n=1 Tax=Planctomonas sp. JC2975 TaxID=2729626 RepID=UPI001475B64E|nr:hypothetical protein [Planctomonas sp. JC2975]NNC12234.1 hypothetical protein [Planctomonas sp. JC2975]